MKFSSAAFLSAWAVAALSAARAASLASPGCPLVQSGNLSPNGVPGNFALYDGFLGFDPSDLATGFEVSFYSCAAAPGFRRHATQYGTLSAPSGECLAANSTSSASPSVAAVNCTTAASAGAATWATYAGFLFWAGPATAACPSGLYGYAASDSSGRPNILKAPITLGCYTQSYVFGFSILS